MLQHSLSKSLTLATVLLTFFFGCAETPTEKITDNIETKEVYQEMHRPQFHFTPEANWMNDPNGMFYHEGKYHLFYQYFPDSTVWGPMHWGHAESKDMVHWEHLPIALFPDSLGCIFSGGAVVDINNTSKLSTSDTPPIVATFTHHNFDGEKAKTNDFQFQSLAYSIDGGNEWKKYEQNPVIPNTEKIKDFRDPKVVWHEPSQKWILVLAAYDRVKFYASPNLTDWEYLSDFGIEGDTRLWECPDLFPMKMEGAAEEKWVLIVSIQKDAPNDGTATSYFVGEFDGREFISDIKTQKWLDWGTDNYAFVTWNNLPKKDDRTTGIGWMSNWQYAQIVPTEKWRSAMTLPRELKLFKSGSEYVINSMPVAELKALRGKPATLGAMNITKNEALKGDFDVSQAEYLLNIDLKKSTSNSFGLKFENSLGEYLVVTFDKEAGTMYVDRTNSCKQQFSEKFFNKVHAAPVNFEKDDLKVHLFVDAASLEIFIDDGAVSFTDIFFPTEKFDKVSFFSNGGICNISDAEIYGLNDIWN